MRFHKIANVNKALDFIASKGVKLVSIGAEGREVAGEDLAGGWRAVPASSRFCEPQSLHPRSRPSRPLGRGC